MKNMKKTAIGLILFTACGWAGAFAPTPGLESEENCGEPMSPPNWVDSTFNKDRAAAAYRFQACFQRNEALKRRNFDRLQKQMEGIVYSTREACKQAVRRLSSQPSTLSFDNGKNFEFIYGLNGSGVDSTDGGYSVDLSGSSAGGRFRAKCYMDERFNVTNVR